MMTWVLVVLCRFLVCFVLPNLPLCTPCWPITSPIRSNLIKKAFASWQNDFLSTIASRFTRPCAGIKILSEVKVTYGVVRPFALFCFFTALISFAFLFSPFLIFLLQWLILYWTCFQVEKIHRKLTSSGQAIFTIIATRSSRQFCSELFHSHFWAFSFVFQAPLSQSHISGHHWKIFSSYKSWV